MAEKVIYVCRDKRLEIGQKTYIMGILNITPDSFSDGGKYDSIEAAVRKAKEMVSEGADIIDVGGESTRPGYTFVESDEEIRRVVPVIERLTKEIDVPISIDTSKADVARKALEAGAHIVNDIWGMQLDTGMATVVGEFGAGVIVMHNKNGTDYVDMITEIKEFLQNSISIAQKAGLKSESICIDPGIGFGKNFDQNIEVMSRVKEFKALGYPVLLGTSRKSFIGKVLDLPVEDRVEGTAATVALGIAYGVDFVRVHDVGQISRTVKMTDAIVRRKMT